MPLQTPQRLRPPRLLTAALLPALLALAAGACSTVEPLHPRIQYRQGWTDTKFHIRNGSGTKAGTDLFPWDTGAWGTRSSQALRGSLDTTSLLGLESEFWIDRSTVDASGSASLDPARTWYWNGSVITSFRSDVSFERLALGWTARTPVWSPLHAIWGVDAEGLRFDGDIVTNLGTEPFEFNSLWVTPQVGLGAELPAGFRLQLLYGGFNHAALSFGDDVRRPYTFRAALAWNWESFVAEIGYELYHVEQERSFGLPSREFAHIRLRSFYLAGGVRF